MGAIKPKYDHYENNMFLDDPVNADLKRKKRVAAPKIGTEPRVRYPTVLHSHLSFIFIDAPYFVRAKPRRSPVPAQGQA
jgi:hypothetical protein